jgi:glutamate-ammonia-ligase adenylyltransferase
VVAPSKLSPALAAADFHDLARAEHNLERIAAAVTPRVVGALQHLLAEIPDPDSALNLFERFVAAAPPQVSRQLDARPLLVHYALAVFGFSHYLSDTLIQNPDLFAGFEREKEMEHSRSADEYREKLAAFAAQSGTDDLPLVLARFRRREYVRIMLRDLLGIATLGDVTAEISALTDAIVGYALAAAGDSLTLRYRPVLNSVPAFSVLGLGKLGGNELNYSSDVDLFFLYRDLEHTAAESAQLSPREFVIRLSQSVMEMLSRLTAEGPVFRIDLRLRPQGGEGEPVVGLAHVRHYYAAVAHDWELQAMLKARHVAGDAALTREFLAAVQPFVYKRELNFAAIETALASRQRIGRRRRPRREHGIDVKLDHGGIRDIEFLTQCLQRVYGGAEPWLRSAGTLLALQRLHDKGRVAGHDFHQLSTTYIFLRRLEHRLQLRRGQQTHRLPASAEELRIMARALRAASPQQEPIPDLTALVRTRMSAVAAIYDRIVHHQQQHGNDFRLEDDRAAPALGEEASVRQALQRVAADAPEVRDVIRRVDLTPTARRNLHRFLSAILTSPERYTQGLRDARAFERALRLFETSEYLTDLLVRHPGEIALLAPGAEPAGAEELFATKLAEDGRGEAYGEQLAAIRQQHRRALFGSAAADVTSHRNVWTALAENTAAADAAIGAALTAAGAPAGFAVLALGRLGTREFDLASDADLLFLRADSVPLAAAMRAAERVVEALSAYTRDGTVFSVDTRLRPRGMEGELVNTPAQIADYFAADARVWEALSYTKLRHIAGEEDVSRAALVSVRAALARFGRDASTATAVREMRARLEKSEPHDFKLGPGGFYDIDFALTFLMLRSMPGVDRGPTRALLAMLLEKSALAHGDHELFARAADLLRTTDHVIRLVSGRTARALPTAERPRTAVESLTAAILRRTFPAGLAAEIAATRTAVRATYNRLVR